MARRNVMLRIFACSLGGCLTLLVVTSGVGGRAQKSAPLPFSPGETLTYNVNWSVFPAGQVVVTLVGPGKNLAEGYEVKITAQSKGFVSVVYKVKDEFHSFFDPQTLCSHRIIKQVNEGRRHKETEIRFDYARRLALLDERDLSRPQSPAKHDENSIPACVEDVVSAFYFVRNRPIEIGQPIKLAINDGSKTTEVVVEVQEREQIQTGIGSRDAIRVEPKVFGELFKRKGRMLIWFSDDPQHLPLQIKMVLSVGTITGNLASVTSQGGGDPESQP